MWSCDSSVITQIAESSEAGGYLLAQTVQTLMALQCGLVGDHVWPQDAIAEVIEDPNYDFVVVGAGSAGAVVANRLSEVPEWKVLLIEAGGNPTLLTMMPMLFWSNLNTSMDWGYVTQPQNACRSYKNKGCAWPRGKTLGGSSAINGLYYVRGNKADYDSWAAEGNTGWSYDEVLPYFIKSERLNKELTDEMSKYHGVDGYLDVEGASEISDSEKMLLTALEEIGVQTLDFNGASQMGAMRSCITAKDGVRESTATAFLVPVKNRTNLHVINDSYAKKLVYEDNSLNVAGIIFERHGTEYTVNVRKEVVLSAGSINTPQIMMLSGLGPQDHLEELGIECKVNLPVGEYLQDHLFVPTYFTTSGDSSKFSTTKNMAMATEYMLYHNGTLSDTRPNRVIDFINTTDFNSSTPDMQHHYVFFPAGFSNLLDVGAKHGLSEEFLEKFNEINKDHLILGVMSVLLQPKSKGTIKLNSTSIYDKPIITSNYFDASEDMETHIRNLKQHVLKLNDTQAFKEAGLVLNWIVPDSCGDYSNDTDEFYDCIARELTFSLYHPTSTTRMGPVGDDTAVVDPDLKVKNVANLRVADAGVMRRIPRGNTNAPTIMIGEMVSDMIKKDYGMF